MSSIMKNTVYDKFIFLFSGLIGISIIIVIHELGHFLAAHFFCVPTPTFSIGFGPSLLRIPFKNTIFQLALFPLGGYVEINQEILAQQPYIPKMIIMFAGIAFNLLFSCIIIAYYSLQKTTKQISLRSCIQYINEQNTENNGVVGPIGLIYLIGKSFSINRHLFLVMLAMISINIALFNLLPLPFLDGGQALIFTFKELMGTHYPSSSISVISMILLLSFIVLIGIISIFDIKKFCHK